MKSRESTTVHARAGLSWPPAVLKKIYERNPTGQVADVLGRLLTDPRMGGAWRELGKRVKSDRKWLEVWGAIRTAHSYSRRIGRMPSRAEEQKKFDVIASRAKELSDLIRGREMDLLAYDLFSPEDMQILGVKNWDELDSLERNDAASTLLSYWPSSADLLASLAYQASVRAHNARHSLRLFERTTRDARAIVFVRSLTAHFIRTFGSPMYGTVAAITQVALRKDCDKAFVANTVKRTPRKLDFSLPV